MKNLRDKERIFKILSSILFRIVLVSMGVYSNYLYGMYFSIYVYIVSIVIYLILYIILVRNAISKNNVRLIFDFCIIALFLYNKDINNITNLTLLLLPIINSPNNLGNKRSYFVFLMTLTVLIALVGYSESIYGILPLVSLAAIAWLEHKRSVFVETLESLYLILDDFFDKNEPIKAGHKIYKKIFGILSQHKLDGFVQIREIYCFRLFRDKLIIVNSSKWILNVNTSQGFKGFTETDGDYIHNSSILVDGNIKEHNVLIKVPHNSELYIFMLVFGSQPNKVFLQLVLENVLFPIFKKIARHLYSEQNLWDDRQVAIKQINDKAVFVENAIYAMHHVRNKLSPITNYISMSESIDQTSNDSFRTAYLKILDDEKRRASNNIKDIIERTNNILERQGNPFRVDHLSRYSLGRIFGILRKIWENSFPYGEIIIDWDVDDFRCEIYSNTDGLEHAFTDIVRNMEKYSNGNEKLSLICVDGKHEIVFENTVKGDSQHHRNLKIICMQYNSNDSNEISRRKTYGLSLIKTFLGQMKHQNNISLEGNIYKLTITLFDNELIRTIKEEI